MEEMEPTSLGKIFVTVFLISAVVIFGTYMLAGYEVSLLLALVWLAAVIATTAVGIENIITSQIEKLHQHLKGYLLDMYAEMIKKD